MCNTWLRTVVLCVYYHKKEKVREITVFRNGTLYVQLHFM